MGDGVFSGKRILVVDDESDNLNLVSLVLQYHGAEVHPAADGNEGLTKAQVIRPDFILLDLSMPHMDGWALHQKLRELPDFATLPIIALTAHAMAGDEERVLQAGFTGYLSKPIQVATLAQDIQRELNRQE